MINYDQLNQSQLLIIKYIYQIILIIKAVQKMKALFILGPSGSGKSTMSQTLTQIYCKTFGQSSVTLVSLDPANYLSQHKNIQINQLITVQDIMQQYEIGPNAAIIYAMDFLLQNIQWLINKIKQIIAKLKATSKQQAIFNHLFIFDLPGQIQLYINSESVKKIMQEISKLISQQSGTSPCILQLFDCTYMHDVNQFISLCMMSLATMINLQMPHINILNKVDIIKSSQTKPNRGLLDQYFRLTSAQQLVNELKMFGEQDIVTNADTVAKIIDLYGQVSFMPCSIYKQDFIYNLIYELERIFGTLEFSMQNKKFMELIKDVDDFALERAITGLENQFYEEEVQNMEKFQTDIQKQNKNMGI